ncbi:MAG: hypothetical protein HZA49_00340 [Planctomycetes bacterium]|nr:hypothetical protein [Planctomycetota bacterium]
MGIKKTVCLFIFSLLILAPIAPPLLGQDSDLTFLSTLKARSMGMGGAYMGVSYKTESMLWNPAGIQMPPHPDQPGRVHTNLLAAPFVATGLGGMILGGMIEGDGVDELGNEYPTPMTDQAMEGFGVALPFFFKSGSLRNDAGTLVFAANVVEDVLPYETLDKNKRASRDMDVFDNLGYQLGMRARITPQFSVGATAGLYHLYENGGHTSAGTLTMGTMYSPMERLSLGLSYFDFTPGAKDVLLPMERIVDRSTNLGLSFRPDDDTEVAFDVRNLLNDEAEAYGERHIGVERKLVRWLTLRAGYYKQNNTGADVTSFGFQYKNVNYTIVRNNETDIRYHFIQITAALKF